MLTAPGQENQQENQPRMNTEVPGWRTPASAGRRAALAVSLTLVLLTGSARSAESPSTSLAPATRGRLMSIQFTQTGGSELYETLCQGCHMPAGAGATGAASYPALAKDRHLAAKGFPIGRVLYGSKAMPPFSELLSDAQIAAVVSYIRTHFGNAYPGPVSEADVRALRPQEAR